MDQNGKRRSRERPRGTRVAARRGTEAAPPALRGNALATADEQGRVKLPAEFRRRIETRWGRALYLTSLEGSHVWVYPLPVWQQREAHALALTKSHAAVAKFLKRVAYYGAEAELDAQGRLVVPARLRASAALEGELAILGLIDHLELWNDARFRASLEAEPLSPEERRVLAELGL